MDIRKHKKVFLLLCVILAFAAFLSVAFHAHADGQHHDCPVCHFVQSFSILCVPAVIALITALQKSESFSLQSSRVFIPQFCSITFGSRAPPPFSITF